MKGIFMNLFPAGIIVCHTNAQTAVEGNKFPDNWSIGTGTGGTAPLTRYSFFGNLHPIMGIGLNKRLTPVFGLGLEATESFNASQSKTTFGRSNINLLGLVNLNSLLGIYAGVPRPSEIKAAAGTGWLHYHINRRMGSNQNSMSTRLGLDFNLSLGGNKAWTLAFEPALIYDMDVMGAEAVRFHSKRAVWGTSAGLKYHLGCSNGKHYFTKAEPYDQQEIDILNEKINELHSQVGKNTEALEEAAREVMELKITLDKCRNQKPRVVEDIIDNSRKTLESVVTSRQGRATAAVFYIYFRAHETCCNL